MIFLRRFLSRNDRDEVETEKQIEKRQKTDRERENILQTNFLTFVFTKKILKGKYAPSSPCATAHERRNSSTATANGVDTTES